MRIASYVENQVALRTRRNNRGMERILQSTEKNKRGERMTGYLYRLILDVTIKADSKEDADEIAGDLGVNDMDVEVWSSETRYMGIDEEEGAKE